MRVHIEFTVDIDAEAWTANYGIEGAAAIRQDVKAHVAAEAVAQLWALDLATGSR